MLPKRFSLFICLFIGLALISYRPTFATEEVIEGTANPNALPITAEEKAVLAKLTYPANMEASVYAREPMVQNPTAISMDESGRLFISETHRFDRGVEDNRRNIPWLIEDFAIQNTTERRSMYAKHAMRKGVGYFTKYDEKIRVIVDTDKDGRADKHEVFAEGFNDELDGTAAGVFAADGKVYFACIPNVWMLEDTDGDLKADKKESLQEGYGISVSISGHDLNGFKYGPDGRIYFSIGDRGYNLKTPDGRQLIQLNGGSVFRMEPDGSDLTEVHTGLRNPKEIAFDNYGNLFSVDNNADMKDLPRIVHVVEGGYSGWHRGHQHLHNFR
ncbi:MAG: glucose dehydrogenase, partial [Verrucomicrobiota bacterium]